MTDTPAPVHTPARLRVARPPRSVPGHRAGGPAVSTGSAARRPSAQVLRGLALPALLALAVTAAAPAVLTVRQGDTLSEIAQRHGLSVAELQSINSMGNSTLIYAGQELRLAGGAPAGGGSASSGGAYRILPGDTVSGIAQRFGVTQSALAAANGISASDVIYAGKTLTIPGGSSPASPSGSSSSAGGSSSGGSEQLSRSQVRDLIRQTAQQYGVDPSLALAIAHQESGFQQGVVSHADAIGVMQVLPTTVDWMEQVVGHDLDPYDVRDNVETGVALLKVLREQASVEDTIAAYYQGLRAVRERGWFEETKVYVANVRALQSRYYS